jgi:hypothetical protein
MLLIVLLAAFLTSGAFPVWAGEVTVDAVAAAQYRYGIFIALVYAHGARDLIDVQLVVNDTPIVADQVEDDVDPSTNATRWKILKHAPDVVAPGDTLTAVVTDAEGDSGVRGAACRTEYAGWWLAAVCKSSGAGGARTGWSGPGR